MYSCINNKHFLVLFFFLKNFKIHVKRIKLNLFIISMQCLTNNNFCLFLSSKFKNYLIEYKRLIKIYIVACKKIKIILMFYFNISTINVGFKIFVCKFFF